LPSSLHIQSHISRQLLLLLSDLSIQSGLSLRLLDLKSQNISLQLQDFVLDFAILKSGFCVSSDTLERVVEASSCNLGLLAYLGCV
jgi:hypothetical protein